MFTVRVWEVKRENINSLCNSPCSYSVSSDEPIKLESDSNKYTACPQCHSTTISAVMKYDINEGY